MLEDILEMLWKGLGGWGSKERLRWIVIWVKRFIRISISTIDRQMGQTASSMAGALRSSQLSRQSPGGGSLWRVKVFMPCHWCLIHTMSLSPVPGWQGEGREFQGGICNSEDVGEAGAHLVKRSPSYR